MALTSRSRCAELSLDHVRIAEVGTKFGIRFESRVPSRTGREARARDHNLDFAGAVLIGPRTAVLSMV